MPLHYPAAADIALVEVYELLGARPQREASRGEKRLTGTGLHSQRSPARLDPCVERGLSVAETAA